jgi:hypothetical protein
MLHILSVALNAPLNGSYFVTDFIEYSVSDEKKFLNGKLVEFRVLSPSCKG